MINFAKDVDRYRRLWFVWPLVAAAYLLAFSPFVPPPSPIFLITLYGTAISGRWAALSTAVVGSAFVIHFYATTDPFRAVVFSLTLFLIPPSILALRMLGRRSQELIESLNGNLVKLREANLAIEAILTGDFSEVETRRHLAIVQDRIVNLLAVSGLWVEISRQRKADIERWERENRSGEARDE